MRQAVDEFGAPLQFAGARHDHDAAGALGAGSDGNPSHSEIGIAGADLAAIRRAGGLTSLGAFALCGCCA